MMKRRSVFGLPVVAAMTAASVAAFGRNAPDNLSQQTGVGRHLFGVNTTGNHDLSDPDVCKFLAEEHQRGISAFALSGGFDEALTTRNTEKDGRQYTAATVYVVSEQDMESALRRAYELGASR
jgi:hypothetical protein